MRGQDSTHLTPKRAIFLAFPQITNDFCWNFAWPFQQTVWITGISGLMFPSKAFYLQLFLYPFHWQAVRKQETFLFFWLHWTACRILVPRAGIEPGLLQWKHWGLTTGLVENSLGNLQTPVPRLDSVGLVSVGSQHPASLQSYLVGKSVNFALSFFMFKEKTQIHTNKTAQ